MTLDRLFVECSALGFQSVLTSALALTCYVLWLRQRGDHFLTWSLAWALYVVRLAAMSAFLVRRDFFWLFVHQAMTGLSALLLLAAALQLSGRFQWRPWHVVTIPLVIGWSWVAIYAIDSMVVAGVSSVAMLASVTILTGVLLWRQHHRIPGGGAKVLAWSFILWGIHHLDYPLLRSFGAAVLYGVFVDVIFLFAIGLGMLFLVLGDERNRLAVRTSELEQLTRLLLRAQEDERRRIARELHDEAGQALTAVKIELDLDGHRDAADKVGRALAQVRDLSNLLRPSALDDLGLSAALRALAADVSERSRIKVDLDIDTGGRTFPPEIEVVLYRVVQEALTNIVRHARATWVRARLASGGPEVLLTVEDDGQGLAPGVEPKLGWLGMQERVTAAGGTLTIAPASHSGVRVTARIPLAAGAS
ncbi:MAG TPA: sensor histidine kinase [Vicinamibacterales bacterium]|nr:sensor histidine kinase [Vicinamibacterales bacterium]